MASRQRPFPLDAVSAKFDMESWLLRSVVISEAYPPEYVVTCPICGRDKCAVNVEIKAWHCLSGSCGWSGWDPTTFISESLKASYSAARAVMVRQAMDEGPLPEPKKVEFVRTSLPTGTFPPTRELAALPVGGAGRSAMEYLRRRGCPRRRIEEFQLRVVLSSFDVSSGLPTKMERMLAYRLLIPVFMDNRAVYWTARAIFGETLKTINMPRSCRKYKHPSDCTCAHVEWGFPNPVPYSATAGEVVLGLHLVEPGSPVIVVEGDMDAVVCGPGFVATLGAHCTPEQAMQIARTGASEAIVLFDGDQAGENARWKAAKELDLHLPTRVATCPPGSDPAMLGGRVAREIALRAPRPGGLPTIQRRATSSEWAWPEQPRPLEPFKEA